MTTDTKLSFDVLLTEERQHPPPSEFVAQANVSDPQIYADADADYEAFWAKQAEALDWFQKWDTTSRVEPSLGQMVRGRQNQCVVQLPRSPPGLEGHQKGDHVGGRVWRRGDLYL